MIDSHDPYNNTEELVSLLFSVSRLMRERFAGCQRMDPVSLARLKILAVISKGGSLTMKEIAETLYITYPSATAMIARLVKAGEVERVFDPTDRRVVRVALTAKGNVVFKKHRKKAIDNMDGILKKLTIAQRKALGSMLKKIIS